MLAKFPEVARKAQQEIDEVVGLDRMPTENDLPKLKYMHAIIEEVTEALVCESRTAYTRTSCSASILLGPSAFLMKC